MDVPHARAQTGNEALRNISQQLHVRTSRLNAGHVSVQSVNRVDNLVELRVAQVGVNLSGILHRAGCQAEGVHRPVQVLRLLVAAQGQQLTQSRLVHLNDADARLLQVSNLVGKSQSHLVSGLTARLVVTHEGPRQNRHRAGEHALDRLVAQRLCVGAPRNGERLTAQTLTVTLHVTEQDRGAGATRTVGLNPAVAGGCETVEVLSEVLNHVVTLSLTVNQNVQAQLLLQRDDRGDLVTQEAVQLLSGNLARTSLRTVAANLSGLREGADGGGR